MTNEEMCSWVDRGFLMYASLKTILVSDGLGAHKQEHIRERFKDHDVIYYTMPPARAPKLSPLDNSFFATLKAKLRSEPITSEHN